MAQEYLLAKYPPLREIIYEAMLAQVVYNLNNGFIQDYSGVNVVKGTAMEVRTMRDRSIAQDAIAELERILPCGYCIVYRGAIRLLTRPNREGY